MATVIATTAKRDDLTRLIRTLPAVLAGRAADPHGIGAGFRARLAFSFLSLVKLDFDKKSKGGVGADGKKWLPNTREYLAYKKGRFIAAGRYTKTGQPRHRVNRREHLTSQQFRQWNRDYRASLKTFSVRHTADKARSMAVNAAWAKSRQDGAKTLISQYGNQEDTILVDTGDLRNSLQPGELTENGAAATYQPEDEQVFRESPGVVLVGSKNKYAAAHHKAKKQRHGDGQKGTVQRRLWPETFPAAWWDEILGVSVGGLRRIGELVGSGRL